MSQVHKVQVQVQVPRYQVQVQVQILNLQVQVRVQLPGICTRVVLEYKYKYQVLHLCPSVLSKVDDFVTLEPALMGLCPSGFQPPMANEYCCVVVVVESRLTSICLKFYFVESRSSFKIFYSRK